MSLQTSMSVIETHSRRVMPACFEASHHHWLDYLQATMPLAFLGMLLTACALMEPNTLGAMCASKGGCMYLHNATAQAGKAVAHSAASNGHPQTCCDTAQVISLVCWPNLMIPKRKAWQQHSITWCWAAGRSAAQLLPAPSACGSHAWAARCRWPLSGG